MQGKATIGGHPIHSHAGSIMMLNLVTVVIFAAAFYVRLGNATATLGYVLTVVGVLVLFASGYLGGKLVFQGGVGVA